MTKFRGGKSQGFPTFVSIPDCIMFFIIILYRNIEMAGASTAWQLLLLMFAPMLINTFSVSRFRGAIIMARPAPEGSQYDVSDAEE